MGMRFIGSWDWREARVVEGMGLGRNDVYDVRDFGWGLSMISRGSCFGI